MLKTITVAVTRWRKNNEALDFEVVDPSNKKEYQLSYSHRTDNRWFGFCTKCYFGELYSNKKDLGPAFLQWTLGKGWILSFKSDN